MLSVRRNLGAACRFFKKAISRNGVPHKIGIDKSRANLAGTQAVNTILKITGTGKAIEIPQRRIPHSLTNNPSDAEFKREVSHVYMFLGLARYIFIIKLFLTEAESLP